MAHKLIQRLAMALSVPLLLAGQSISSDSLSPGWLPTELPDGARYVGSGQCIRCHAAQSSALQTSMGRALQSPQESELLRQHEKLTFRNGPYSYQISRTPQGVRYAVSDGRETIAVPLGWSLGHGKAGQTYIFERDGNLYESRVSYFVQANGLDQTLGAPPGSVPRDLGEAAGRHIPDTEARTCFGCHSTGAVQSGKLDLANLVPGLQCEGCHGPGAAHVETVEKAEFSDLKIRSLKNMIAENQNDFCGSCHRTWSQVMLMNLQGPGNVRFQPYRLTNSRCYNTNDPRIRCTACHDPHRNPNAEATSYDAKCLACHESGSNAHAGRGNGSPGTGAATNFGSAASAPMVATAPACPVGKENCTQCHMPRVAIPGAHFEFTDHQIRIQRPGDAYPN